MVPGSAQNWIAVKCKFNNPTSTKEMKTKTMTTLHLRKSIGRSPCQGAFLLIPLAIATFGLTLIFNPVAAHAEPFGFNLVPASDPIAACLPDAVARVTVFPREDICGLPDRNAGASLRRG